MGNGVATGGGGCCCGCGGCGGGRRVPAERWVVRQVLRMRMVSHTPHTPRGRATQRCGRTEFVCRARASGSVRSVSRPRPGPVCLPAPARPGPARFILLSGPARPGPISFLVRPGPSGPARPGSISFLARPGPARFLFLSGPARPDFFSCPATRPGLTRPGLVRPQPGPTRAGPVRLGSVIRRVEPSLQDPACLAPPNYGHGQ